MVTLYCTNKLQNYIGFKENQIGLYNNNDLNSWNAHLFTLNRKKCLLFMNHETYFSFVTYNIKKSDIKNLDQLFIKGFLFELNKLKLIKKDQEEQLKTSFSSVFLHGSINNKKVIGNINNHLKILDHYKHEFENMQDYFNSKTLNEIPLKQTNYIFPYKAMQTKINQLFKGHLKIT